MIRFAWLFPWHLQIDKAFLDKQVEEKQRQREWEQAKECQLDETLIRNSEFAVHLERQQEEVIECRQCR